MESKSFRRPAEKGLRKMGAAEVANIIINRSCPAGGVRKGQTERGKKAPTTSIPILMDKAAIGLMDEIGLALLPPPTCMCVYPSSPSTDEEMH